MSSSGTLAGGRGRATEYRLTPAGVALQRVIDDLGEWGACWAFGDPRPTELDPMVLLWWMRRRVHLDRVWLGRMPLAQALRDGLVDLDGMPATVRALQAFGPLRARRVQR